MLQIIRWVNHLVVEGASSLEVIVVCEASVSESLKVHLLKLSYHHYNQALSHIVKT